MSKLFVVVEGDEREDTEWSLGTELAAQLLGDIDLVSKQAAPFRIDREYYKVYWCGSVLRIDLSEKAIPGRDSYYEEVS